MKLCLIKLQANDFDWLKSSILSYISRRFWNRGCWLSNPIIAQVYWKVVMLWNKIAGKSRCCCKRSRYSKGSMALSCLFERGSRHNYSSLWPCTLSQMLFCCCQVSLLPGPGHKIRENLSAMTTSDALDGGVLLYSVYVLRSTSSKLESFHFI